MLHGNLGDGDGTVAVGTTESYSVRGISDMAGNVREWVWNAAGTDRYILGGSWRSPAHIYTGFDATDPWSRDQENGFRCARFIDEPVASVSAPITSPVFDFTGYQPVDDATFAVYETFFEYDPAPLDAERRVVGETEEWTREYVEFDAAYGDERIPAHVFLPENSAPPYQTVVYVPGSSAFFIPSSENTAEMSALMFVPQSGRALVYPVLSNFYERRFERPARGEAELRQRMVWSTQDVMRTMDYIEERDDLDAGATAYLGLSYGAEMVLPVSMEKRFATAVLVGAALDPGWRGGVPEEVAPWNHVFRVTTPTLVVNGRYDFMHPYDESQVPFFDAIAVPPEDKRFVVLDAGHVPPRADVIRPTLTWLDERLGAVELRRR